VLLACIHLVLERNVALQRDCLEEHEKQHELESHPAVVLAMLLSLVSQQVDLQGKHAGVWMHLSVVNFLNRTVRP
jgi:hypothetical protein